MKKKYNGLYKISSMHCVQFFAIAQLLLLQSTLYAQDGNAGINQANQAVRSYFDSGTHLMYGVGALLGLIGAVKVYQK